MPGHVFISHASADADIAAAVEHALEAAGIPSWLAPRDVPVGTRYADAILTAIGAASACVVLLSAAATESEFVEREVERAVSLGIPVLPVRLDGAALTPAFELYLSSVQWIEAA